MTNDSPKLDLKELFQKFDTMEAHEERPKRVGATTDSIALIASNSGHGCILAHDGPGIEADIESLGTGDLQDHGLDDAPDGISIWEGYLDVSPGPYEYPDDVECCLEGTFRDLTTSEWNLYRETGVPWTFEK